MGFACRFWTELTSSYKCSTRVLFEATHCVSRPVHLSKDILRDTTTYFSAEVEAPRASVEAAPEPAPVVAHTIDLLNSSATQQFNMLTSTEVSLEVAAFTKLLQANRECPLLLGEHCLSTCICVCHLRVLFAMDEHKSTLVVVQGRGGLSLFIGPPARATARAARCIRIACQTDLQPAHEWTELTVQWSWHHGQLGLRHAAGST